MVVSELRGEKIDIIPWNPEPARFVAKALSPARVREVYLDDEAREATVVVPDDQLALAIGKEGMNARLAARLTGWKIDIQSDTEFAQAEAEAAFGGGNGEAGEDFSGRCGAILSNGKRCPARGTAACRRIRRLRSRTTTGRSRLPRRQWLTKRRLRSLMMQPRRSKATAQKNLWPQSPPRSLSSQKSNRWRQAFRSSRRPATVTPRSIRQLRDRADQKLHRLRAESSPGAASALCGGGRATRSGRRHAGSRCLYLPPARMLRACGLAPRVQPHAAEDRPHRSGTGIPLHLSI
ncbi:MAG: hypothetical protein ACXVD7_10140 [Actinomycetota bacterium]